jgi:hypothetical protein
MIIVLWQLYTVYVAKKKRGVPTTRYPNVINVCSSLSLILLLIFFFTSTPSEVESYDFSSRPIHLIDLDPLRAEIDVSKHFSSHICWRYTNNYFLFFLIRFLLFRSTQTQRSDLTNEKPTLHLGVMMLRPSLEVYFSERDDLSSLSSVLRITPLKNTRPKRDSVRYVKTVPRQITKNTTACWRNIPKPMR